MLAIALLCATLLNMVGITDYPVEFLTVAWIVVFIFFTD
jgi:hypothetical protein